MTIDFGAFLAVSALVIVTPGQLLEDRWP